MGEPRARKVRLGKQETGDLLLPDVLKMTETEKISNRVKPSAEVRQALNEVERSWAFFHEGAYGDYFAALNEVYLGGRGEVVGPEKKIGLSDTREQDLAEPLRLERAGGAVEMRLKWKRMIGEREAESWVSLTFKYLTSHDQFYMQLYGEQESFGEGEGEGGAVGRGRTLQRDFYVVANARAHPHVDDVLLTFTGELTDFGILEEVEG